MFTLTLSHIKETGYNSISLFLAYCKSGSLRIDNGMFRFFYSQEEDEKFIDLPIDYDELKRAAKKEMLKEINRAGYDEFISLKRKIILDDAIDAPLYKLEFTSGWNQNESNDATYLVHKGLLFQFVKEESWQRA